MSTWNLNANLIEKCNDSWNMQLQLKNDFKKLT